jgi:F-type H+-transporting ATPase subunit gamma
MAQTREIRGQINSIKNTQKITRAMELVAASKMRKAQDRMAASRPYATKIRQVIRHVAQSSSEYHHPYLVARKNAERAGFIVVTSDRGLCGGLNINLFRTLVKFMQEHQQKGIRHDLCLIGRKGKLFFKRHSEGILGVAEQLGDKPAVQDLVGVVKVMLDHYDQGKIDTVYIVYNEFVNTMTQKPIIRQLLPLLDTDESSSGGAEPKKAHWDYIYEPDSAKELLDKLLVRYIESQVYQAVIENLACFQSAQMVAMKSATENAGELIKELQTIYNKARQAGITREIAEIVGGAAAIE